MKYSIVNQDLTTCFFHVIVGWNWQHRQRYTDRWCNCGQNCQQTPRETGETIFLTFIIYTCCLLSQSPTGYVKNCTRGLEHVGQGLFRSRSIYSLWWLIKIIIAIITVIHNNYHYWFVTLCFCFPGSFHVWNRHRHWKRNNQSCCHRHQLFSWYESCLLRFQFFFQFLTPQKSTS